MNGGYIIALVTLAVTAPPSLILTWQSIKKDRAEAADRLAARLAAEREVGRVEAQNALRLTAADQRITDLENELHNRNPEGDS